MNTLFLLAINLTRRCNLACAHCYLDAETLQHGSAGELTTEEVCRLLEEISSRSPETMVVLTGGEPLLRQDLETLVAHGNCHGLSMVVGTNGVLLDEPRVRSLKAAGIMGVGISLDSLDPAYHDRFRGCAGSWNRTLAGMEACRHHAVPFQVHFSVTEENADEVPAMIEFTRSVDARVLNLFFLVCTGRGESMSDISATRYERILRQVIEAQENEPGLIIRARCAPHYKRVVYQRDPHSPLTRAEGYDGGGCLAGLHYCRITPEGDVTPCPYIPTPLGNIRDSGFWHIWENAPTFQQLRQPRLRGKCGECEYRLLCRGCRARPLAQGGDLMDSDSWCTYLPQGDAVIHPLQPAEKDDIRWSEEAAKRLARVPPFLRKMVRKRAEELVCSRGEAMVTPSHLAELRRRRFGDDPPAAGNAAVALTWTREAETFLSSLPPFLQETIRQMAEMLAREEERLEINRKLLRRMEGEEEDDARKLSWKPEAEQRLDARLRERSPQIRPFLRPALEAAAEREAGRRGADSVTAIDVDRALETHTAGVTWSLEALNRVESAPDFIRAGIKKAAEWRARREGLSTITSADLTRFRNQAMMRAVRRMKGLGMRELSFDAFEIARERVPRLKGNRQAEWRFSVIREYVEQHRRPEGGLGLLDREMLERMKAELGKGHTDE